MLNEKDHAAYTRLLANWVKYSQDYVFPVKGEEGLFHYGPGSHGHWGVHTHQKAFSAFAIATADPSIQWETLGLSRELVLKQALGMLRYTCRTHLSGDRPCVNGHPWGHSWIYILGFDRMMHGVEAIERELTASDHEDIKRVFLDEAEWLLNEYPVAAGLVPPDNKPESNIWNGNILIRAAMMYPESEHAKQYLEKGCKFFANGISIPSDETNPKTKDLYVGPNYTEHYGLDHHGYLNVGYMNICLSNIAMLHFSAKHHGWKLPDMVYLHAKELWCLVRTLSFEDGRLLRIGGDSRARYCYCQDFALPTWALAEELWGEDCSSLLSGWLGILLKETTASGDGSFLSERFSFLEDQSPLYYTRLESDRANVISMLVYWYRKYKINPQKKSVTLLAWEDDFFGAAFVSGGNRYASFAWNSCEKPQGLCVPKDDSSFAEWRRNLSGLIRGSGEINNDVIKKHREKTFPGGFISSGYTTCYSDIFIAEGQTKEDVADKIIAFAALPDEKTVLGIQYAVSLNRVYGSMIKGIYWHIPNDIFNQSRRFISSEKGNYTLRGGHWAVTKEILPAGHWVNADGKVGLASILPLSIVRSGKRQIGIAKQPDMNGSLYTEEICAPYEERNRWYEKGEVLIDTAFACQIGNAKDTRKLAESLNAGDFQISSAIRSVSVNGDDGRSYILILNVSDKLVELPPGIWGGRKLNLLGTSSDASQEYSLSPWGALLGYF